MAEQDSKTEPVTEPHRAPDALRLPLGILTFLAVLAALWSAKTVLIPFAVPIMMAVKTACDHVEAFRPVSEILSD